MLAPPGAISRHFDVMIKRSLTRSKLHPNALNKQPDYAKQGATPSQSVLMSRASTLSLLDDRFVRMLDLRSHASALAWPLSLFLVGAAALNPLRMRCFQVLAAQTHARGPPRHRSHPPAPHLASAVFAPCGEMRVSVLRGACALAGKMWAPSHETLQAPGWALEPVSRGVSPGNSHPTYSNHAVELPRKT